MRASNKPQPPAASSLAQLPAAVADAVRAMWDGSLGATVRCVPTRRTVAASVDGEWLFGKWRRGARRAAATEWHWLHVLPLLGLRTAVPLVWIGSSRRSLMVTAGVPGRALDAWIDAAHEEGWLPALGDYACRVVAPTVRRLHDRGLVFRDLYWNHLVVADPRGDSEPVFLDVERVLQPRWRWRRWVAKDLAGLYASLPVDVGQRLPLRFLRAYLGEALRGHRATIATIVRKAARIRAHRPRYGS
jgi:hypothetical protein